MASKFADLDEYFSPGLTLTVLGREYVVPLASAELGLWCRRMAIATGEITSASTPEEARAAVDRANALPELPGDLSLPERVLGDAYAQMVADGVPDQYIQICGSTAYLWIVADEDVARRYWEAGGRPESLRPETNRADRRAAKKSSTGAASGARSPARTSGTSTRRKSGSSGKAARSPGSTS
ncbi:hypothetical protein O7627_24430 [Solwaraspora sp. WMMD1047]|uniref:DUF7426 family protein n=1 Tax=Solwaraspora sp. WMMD1047 TaxID=3016102 RepID=UPI002417F694|nr:hypothetical protein [Solwaraspora sp. WMMD1047]MDG4832431.1 hypothetical protein [Solwaraspora sp. WMMD1047]